MLGFPQFTGGTHEETIYRRADNSNSAGSLIKAAIRSPEIIPQAFCKCLLISGEPDDQENELIT